LALSKAACANVLAVLALTNAPLAYDDAELAASKEALA